MDPLRWQRIGELFAGAQPLGGEPRAAYLKANCGEDPELLQQVVSLLNADGESGPLDSTVTVYNTTVPQVVAGRFRILRHIAEGGMGTVYEAEDLKLGDRIALKTIRSDIVADPRAIERFKREISLGKKVTHPNVCRIYDLGVDRWDNGSEFLFLTMQFLSGETLAARIKRGPLPKEEALPLIEDMTAALSAAHQAEVIHRDFKSGNVMLVKGSERTCAIVTDFGLARHVQDNQSISHAGMVGTVSYMAPEQIRGEELTPATDIYALGVVMYEMATGQLPFKGESKVTVALKHLNDDPKPPREVTPQLDRRWEEVILSCLRKEPQERFQSAEEVRAALEDVWTRPKRNTRTGGARTKVRKRTGLTAGAAAVILAALLLIGLRHKAVALPAQKHIAVLPFENIGNDAQGQAFTEGVVESLTSKLSQLERYQKSFWVVPSNDTKAIKTLDEAQHRFNVTLALTGSVQHTSKDTVINVNLVDVTNHKQLASRTIRAVTSDLDVLQDRVWESVADMVDLQVNPQIAGELAQGGTHQPGAYELYEQGLGYAHRYDVDSDERAIDLFNKAIAKDPNYALAYAGLGNVYASKYAMARDPQWIEKAKSNAHRALELDDRIAEVHVTLGVIYQETGQLDLSLAQFRQALDQDPTVLEANYHIGEVYEAQGKLAQAEEAFKSLLERRPGYWPGYSGLGAFYYRHGEFQKAVQQFQTMIDLQPDNSTGYHDLGAVYVAMGRYDDAVKTFKQGLAIKQTSRAWTNLGAAYMYLNRYPEAADAMKKATDLDPHNHLMWRNLGDSYRQIPGKGADAELAYTRALQAATDELKVNPSNTEVLGGMALYYAHLGDKKQAEDFITKALQLAPHDASTLFTSALVYEIIGHRDKAIASVSAAVAAGYSVQDIEGEPELRQLRSDPKYQRWLRTRSAKPSESQA